jgi:hypothetical protein
MIPGSEFPSSSCTNLLHCGGEDQTGWVQFGEVINMADLEILEGLASSMIIVMPDANKGTRDYFNDPNGDWRYEEFLLRRIYAIC